MLHVIARVSHLRKNEYSVTCDLGVSVVRALYWKPIPLVLLAKLNKHIQHYHMHISFYNFIFMYNLSESDNRTDCIALLIWHSLSVEQQFKQASSNSIYKCMNSCFCEHVDRIDWIQFQTTINLQCTYVQFS